MAEPYKIAIASDDGITVDRSFGAAEKITVYEIRDGSVYASEQRVFTETSNEAECTPDSCGNGCGNGSGTGCGGAVSGKVELISDCRCVVCTKIGFNVRKQLERKAISAFDVQCSVDEALEKLVSYYDKIDKHESLRK